MTLMATYARSKNEIRILNLFEDIEKTDERNLRDQRISTWIFLILFLLSIVTLLYYASLTSVTKTVIIQQPKIRIYKELKSKYPNTLVCPCQKILNAYSTFIVSLIPRFNQICSSHFVSDEWLIFVNYRLLTQMKYHYIFDFRHSAYSFFQMLRTLCTLISQIIADELILFNATTLLTETLLSEEIFFKTTLASKDQFCNITASSFNTSRNSLRTIIQANQIVNRLETNYLLKTVKYNKKEMVDATVVVFPPDGCICSASSYCHTTTGIFNATLKDYPSYEYQDYAYMSTNLFYEIDLLFHVPGINVGCFILDAVLQSNLSCLYNNSCLMQLSSYLNNSSYSFETRALNVFNSSFPTVSNLVDKLMVDEWLFNSSYELYFSQCNPLTCTYTYIKQFDRLFIITTVMGSIGGIVTILMLFILPLVPFTNRYVCHRQRSFIDPTQIERENLKSLRDCFQSLLWKIKDFSINLNLFKDPEDENAHVLENQRISTRVLIVSMFIVLSVLVVYTALTIVTQTVIIKQPTVDVYNEFSRKHPETLVCPCTQISIDYKELLSFDPTFYQICSSDFITKQWIEYLANSVYAFVNFGDLRSIGPSHFTALLAFCNLSSETIDNAMFVFNSTKYITENVHQTDLFQLQTKQIVNLFKQTTINSFSQTLSMGRKIIYGNALFSGLLTNYAFRIINKISSDEVFFPYIYTSNDNIDCSCKINPNTCDQPVEIYKNSISDHSFVFSIPGPSIGCYLTESLFESTSECYFNQSCLDTINEIIGSTTEYPFNATSMIYNSSNTRFNKTTKLKQIIEELMIEQWNDEISFNSYYKQCNPTFCIYTYNKQGDLSYIFTRTIAIIGGLITILKIIILPIVTFVRRNKRSQSIEIELNEHQHVLSFVLQYVEILKKYIKRLNLFKNSNKRSNEEVECQRISTRIFLILFLVSFIVLLIYVSLENVTQITIVENPSIEKFKKLYEQYSDNLRCPCKTLSIKYQNFIRFHPQFHSVCTSDFVTSKTWLTIDYPSSKFDHNGIPTFRTNIDDYRQIASPLFQVLAAFCQLSYQKLNAELLTINLTEFLTPNLVSQQQFQTQTSQIIDQFIKNLARSYEHNDYYYQFIYDQIDRFYNSSFTENNCDCQLNPFCIQQAIVYDLDTTTTLFPIPGIYVGCYIVEALLQSDLRCFYDNICLQQLINSLKISANISSLLNSTSIYETTTTLQEIISNLMIDQWNNHTSYEDYFKQCQPNECSARYVQQGNIPYMITTMTGLIGGLTKVYMFVVPLLVKIIFSLIIRFKRKRIVNIRVIPFERTERKVDHLL